MVKARSFRIKPENQIRLTEIHKRYMLHNENRTLNMIIEKFSEYEKNKKAIEHMKGLMKELYNVQT